MCSRIVTGEYRAGQKHGRGTDALANGTRYEGEYAAGKKSGDGTEWLARAGSPYAVP